MTRNDPHPPDDRDDDVGALIRLAGRRPVVPEQRRARVEEAVRAHWEREVVRRRRVRGVWITAAVAASAAIAVSVAPYVVRRDRSVPLAAGRVLEVEASVGSPVVRGPNGTTLEAGSGVPVGGEVATNEVSRVALRHETGASVRIDEASRIRVVSSTVLVLEAGGVYVDSGPDGERARPITIRTAVGDVAETGTQFEVRLEGDSVKVRVREGAVVLKARDRAHLVSAGSELVADADGRSTVTDIPPDAPAWRWLTEVVPAPEIEGRTAEAFLEWAAREGGWTLEYAHDEVARAASATVLRGSVRGLTLAQALGAVLPTCRMTHRIEGGTIVVDATDN